MYYKVVSKNWGNGEEKMAKFFTYFFGAVLVIGLVGVVGLSANPAYREIHGAEPTSGIDGGVTDSDLTSAGALWAEKCINTPEACEGDQIFFDENYSWDSKRPISEILKELKATKKLHVITRVVIAEKNIPKQHQP